MALFKQKHFDLEGGAHSLVWGSNDIFYYIKEDQLRLAFKFDHVDFVIFNESLLESLQRVLASSFEAFPLSDGMLTSEKFSDFVSKQLRIGSSNLKLI